MECGWEDPFGSGAPKNESRRGRNWGDLRISETSVNTPQILERPSNSKSLPSSSSVSTSASSAATGRSRVYKYNNKLAAQNVKCLVDNCEYDINKCRDNHRRHRVCETHSKTAVVRVKGKPQRFCQQCSRFHSLDEFDEYKRSCRRRLDGHNRRRRKPHHPPPLYFASDYAGPRLLQFGTPPNVTDLYGNVNAYLSMWPAMSYLTAAEYTTFNRFTPIFPKIDPQSHHHHQLGSFASIQYYDDSQGRQIIPLMMHPNNVNELGVASGFGNVSENINSCKIKVNHHHPDCALYLLSALHQEQNCHIGNGNNSSAGKCLCSGSAIIEEAADNNMNAVNNNNLHYNEMPHISMDINYGLMENGGSSFTFPYDLEQL